jgi:hypothetical protein
MTIQKPDFLVFGRRSLFTGLIYDKALHKFYFKLFPSQVSVALSRVVLALHNHLHFLGHVLPRPLDKFSLCCIYPVDQEVSTIALDSTTFGIDVWSPDEKTSKENSRKLTKHVDEINVNVGMKCRLRVEYVDFRFLARHVSHI